VPQGPRDLGDGLRPCGKDLSTAGGSRDRSDAVAREIYEREPPLNFPYEFLNIGGRKMSTSKGTGATAHQMADVVPPEQLRFLFIRPRPNSVIEFDPEGTNAIPRLFDEFDRVADAAAGREVKGTLPPSPERLFAYASLSTDPAVVAERAAAARLAFAHVAFLVQQPATDLPSAAASEKGSPLSAVDLEILHEREGAARRWLETYAPEDARIRIQPSLPDAAGELDAQQRGFLRALADEARTAEGGVGAGWQETIFRVAQVTDTPPGRAFEAIYRAFLGRTSGPRAGWLLASLERPFVLARLDEASGMVAAQA